MSVQSLVGTNSLVAIGVGVGDIASMVTIGRRVGNWLTAERGDAELLSLLEEDEFNFMQRRGSIDITRFNTRWDRRLRILENGAPRRFEGDKVEVLLQTSSRFTAIMTCITAALDEFASSQTTRNVCKSLLERLLQSREAHEITAEFVDSAINARINGWRSAATVREMNVECHKLHLRLQELDLTQPGLMPAEDADEVVEFLNWLISETSDIHHTSSSDVAGIAYCLSHLSFEILRVENFGYIADTQSSCRLIYNDSPLPDADRKMPRSRRQVQRELCTIVSLTQPEETFSVFPISRQMANRCRVAWEDGAKAAKFISLTHITSGPTLTLQNDGTPIRDQGRQDSWTWGISNIAIFNTQEVCEGLHAALGREPRKILDGLKN